MTNAKTKLVCLIGKPARHSLSPLMHNAGYKALGLNYTYLAFEIANVKKAVEGMKEMEVAGFNVTMPFKTEVIKYLDSVEPIAKKIGAVNTVVNKNGKLKGYNTDGLGAIEALKKLTAIKGKKVLLLGAGGAGRAIGFFLKKEGAAITLADRSEEKASELAKFLRSKNVPLDSINSLSRFDIVINASPAGMSPNTNQTPIQGKLLTSNIIVFDIVYDPLETKFLRQAKLAGCRTISGIEMLLEQGYTGFKLFTGANAPRNEMRNAVLEELR